MTDTKQKILLCALRLFAKDGYSAVSVSMISGELGISKSALYKHYKSKRDILDSILRKMSDLDAEHASEHGMPQEMLSDAPDEYHGYRIDDIFAFALSQFRYWTEDEFASCFRKMLTIEQYESEGMAVLYEQYLAGGPLSYVEDLFKGIGCPNPELLSFRLYAPMFLMYSVYDVAKDKSYAYDKLATHLSQLREELTCTRNTSSENDFIEHRKEK